MSTEEKPDSWVEDEMIMKSEEESFDLASTIGAGSEAELSCSDNETDDELETDDEPDSGKASTSLGFKSQSCGTGKGQRGVLASPPSPRGKNLSLLLQQVPLEEPADNEGEAKRVPSPGLKDNWLNQFLLVSDVHTGGSAEQQKLYEKVKLLLERVESLEVKNKTRAAQIAILKRTATVQIVRKSGYIGRLKQRIRRQKNQLEQKDQLLRQQSQEYENSRSDNEILIQNQKIQIDLLLTANSYLDQRIILKDQEIQKLKENQFSIEDFLLDSDADFQLSPGWFDDFLGAEGASQVSKGTQTIPDTIPEIKLQVSLDCPNEILETNAALSVKSIEVKRDHAELSGSEVSSTNESPNKKVKTERKSQQRKVKEGYFRWTKDRNIQLLTVLIDELNNALENLHEFQVPKESDILEKVNEACGGIFPKNKIRDQINNLLRSPKYSPKGSKRELKAYSREYINQLESIRSQIQREIDKSATV